MAIDSVAKRASAILPGMPRPILPIPDGTIAQGDRQAAAWLYSGILAAEPEVPDTVDLAALWDVDTFSADWNTETYAALWDVDTFSADWSD